MCILLWNLLWGNAMGTRGNTGTHLGADVTADAAQTLWTVWSNWCVKYHLINWENPANLIRELHITRAPLLLAIWKITCEHWWGRTDQNKWCFCVGLVAGGCRVTSSWCWEGVAVAMTETKWIWMQLTPVSLGIKPQNLLRNNQNVSPASSIQHSEIKI